MPHEKLEVQPWKRRNELAIERGPRTDEKTVDLRKILGSIACAASKTDQECVMGI